MVNKLSAYKTYLLFSAITAMCFSLVATVMIVYHIETVHLNPLQLILVGTTLEVACFIFEIPTGIVADVYSRKLSIVIGVVLTGVGFILEGSISSFVFILAAQIIWGLGSTFISGSVEAWIAEEEKDKDLDKIYIKGAQAGQIGSVIGIVLSTVIANFSVRLPIIVSGVLFIILALFLWLYMPENNSTLASQATNSSVVFVKGEEGRETTELFTKLDNWEKDRRFVVSRVLKPEKERAQISLLEGSEYEYFFFVTNTTLLSEKVVISYEKRGNAENYIKEAKYDMAVGHLLLKSFWANEAVFQMMMLSYNLFLLFKIDSLEPSEYRQQIKTFRLKYVFLAAKIIKTARTVIMNLSENYPYKEVYEKCLV